MDDTFPVNAQAWQALLPMNGGIFSLGPTAQQSVVEEYICNNPGDTFPITASIFYIADAYYGWGYPDLSKILGSSGCP
jgi:hypothetical protein